MKLYDQRDREAKQVLALTEGVNNDAIDEGLSISIGGALIMLYRYNDAKRFLEYATKRFPENDELVFDLALLYFRKWRLVKFIKEKKGLNKQYQKHLNEQLNIETKTILFSISILIVFLTLTLITNLAVFKIILIVLVVIYLVVFCLINLVEYSIPRKSLLKDGPDRWAFFPEDMPADSAVEEKV